jgi:DNA-binding MarR family transcriptional regulator
MARPSAERIEVWRRWLLAQKVLVERLDRELREQCDMTLEDYDVLVQLAQQPALRARMSDLADALLIARSSCTRIVGRLEDVGWVRRESDADDRRVVWAALTPTGRRRLRRAAVVHLTGVQDAFARHLTVTDVARLDVVLDKILSAAE